MTHTVLREDDGNRRILTLNRPEDRNALNPELVETLTGELRVAVEDEAVRVIVLTGAGKSFCAGADLKVMSSLQIATSRENLEDCRRLMALYRDLARCPKPVVAAVNGHALAGGCGLAALCDIILAVPEAKFGYPEVRIGFVAAMVMVFLQRAIGDRKARELLLLGEAVTAEEAVGFGLVNCVVPSGEIAGETRRLCETLALAAPASVAFTKELLYHASGLSLEQALDLASTVNAMSRSTPDMAEGLQAFLEKRRPSWNR